MKIMVTRGKSINMLRKKIVHIPWRKILPGRQKSKYEGPETEKFSVY